MLQRADGMLPDIIRRADGVLVNAIYRADGELVYQGFVLPINVFKRRLTLTREVSLLGEDVIKVNLYESVPYGSTDIDLVTFSPIGGTFTDVVIRSTGFPYTVRLIFSLRDSSPAPRARVAIPVEGDVFISDPADTHDNNIPLNFGTDVEWRSRLPNRGDSIETDVYFAFIESSYQITLTDNVAGVNGTEVPKSLVSEIAFTPALQRNLRFSLLDNFEADDAFRFSVSSVGLFDTDGVATDLTRYDSNYTRQVLALVIDDDNEANLVNVRFNYQKATLPAVDDTSVFVGATVDKLLPAASNGVTPYIYSIVETLGSGLSFDPATRVFSGSHSNRNDFALTYRVTDKLGVNIDQTFNLRVGVGVLTIPATSRIALVSGTPISVTLPVASGGTGPYTYELSTGLQSGLSFNPTTRVLSGTPTATAEVTLTYTATDSLGNTGIAEITVGNEPSLWTRTGTVVAVGGFTRIQLNSAPPGGSSTVRFAWRCRVQLDTSESTNSNDRSGTCPQGWFVSNSDLSYTSVT